MKYDFGQYVVRVKPYHLVDGANGSTVLLMLWLDDSTVIDFLGAVVSARLWSKGCFRDSPLHRSRRNCL